MNPNELTPKQQSSEAIRQAETILILTGQHPTIDQTAATIALASILRKFGKKVTAIISDNVPQQVSFLPTSEIDRGMDGLRDFIIRVDQTKAVAEKLRYEVEGEKLNIYLTPQKGGFAPSDITYAHGDFHYDLAIVLGVPTRARIDKVYAENASLFTTLPIVNLDYHRSNENYGAINLIEPTAASLCEMLVALAESLQSGMIDETLATCLLAGIISSTDRFTAAHTTSKSLTVAAQMMAAGAKQQVIVKSLFRERSDTSDARGRSSDRIVGVAEQSRPVNNPAPAPSKLAQNFTSTRSAEASRPTEPATLLNLLRPRKLPSGPRLHHAPLKMLLSLLRASSRCPCRRWQILLPSPKR